MMVYLSKKRCVALFSTYQRNACCPTLLLAPSCAGETYCVTAQQGYSIFFTWLPLCCMLNRLPSCRAPETTIIPCWHHAVGSSWRRCRRCGV